MISYWLNTGPVFEYCPADSSGRLNPYTYEVDAGYDTARVIWDDSRIRRGARDNLPGVR